LSQNSQLELYVRQTQRNQREIRDLLEQILERLNPIMEAFQGMAISVDDLIAKVQAQTTVVNGVKAVVDQLKTIIASGGTDQAKLQQVSDIVDSNDAILAAINANTAAANEPPAPPVEVPPTTDTTNPPPDTNTTVV